MISVKFLKKYRSYIPGDVVDLDDKTANELIEEGKAKLYASNIPAVSVVVGPSEGDSPSADE